MYLRCPACNREIDWVEYSAVTRGWEYGTMDKDSCIMDVYESDNNEVIIEEYFCPECSHGEHTMDAFLVEDDNIPLETTTFNEDYSERKTLVFERRENE